MIHFRQPIFHIMVLFVDEAESVARQLKRGRQVVAHNEEVTRLAWANGGRNGRRTLARGWPDPLPRVQGANLTRWFPLSRSSITTSSTPRRPSPNAGRHRPRAGIPKSLELDPRTFDQLRRLPLASQIVRHARQDLVGRLDGYEVEQPETFRRVIEFIEDKMMPIVVRHRSRASPASTPKNCSSRTRQPWRC